MPLVVLDDLGGGYSNLAYLHRLPILLLKMN
jgi:sensor c-di-GMP phosphodiesterase-like protein